MEITAKTLTMIGIIAIAVTVTSAYFMLQDEDELMLATTTSTYDSGLLDYILPPFEEENDVIVNVLAVGTGQALEYGKRGDCDVILVHSRTSEDEFMNEGYGSLRFCVMYNDFVIVGPLDDPADLLSISPVNVTQAFLTIYEEGKAGNIKFISRGDDSGTHKREKLLWEKAGFDYENDIVIPENVDWYWSVSQGMGSTLQMANWEMAYTLTDRGTWIALKSNLEDLKIVLEEDPDLVNPYGVIAVNQTLHPYVKLDLAKKLIKFLISTEGQQLINNYTKGGEQLFFPLWDENGHHLHYTNCPTVHEEEMNRPEVGLDPPPYTDILNEGIMILNRKFAILT
ncbi:MAG: substrate-binding domain-containing protein [Candidatus Hodarchaeota archaeon]